MMKKPVHLVMVTTNNNNKYYDMIPQSDHIVIKYGRINATCVTLTKPLSDWDKIYSSKIKKGYVDKSYLIEEAIAINDDYAPIKVPSIAKLIDKLQHFANKTLQQNYSVEDGKVTNAMIEEARTVLDGLSHCKSLTDFNANLLNLFTIIPRKMKQVNDYLATSTRDFAGILDKETDLLNVMATKVATNNAKHTAVMNQQTLLESLGLTISEKDNELESQVTDMLGEMADKYINCWYVSNAATEKRFEEHIKTQRGIHKTTQLFWHGSRNENWMSIISNGLMIRPSGAVYTGSMFGDDLYFANRARKSYGYTSSSSAYWVRGSANTVYLAIFKVNTGKHHNVYKHTSECYNFNKNTLKQKGNYDSVYAHKGADLRNDEFMVYDTAQATIYALVELKG